MKHDFFYWAVVVLLTIWQLPQFIVSLFMMPFLGKWTKVADRHFNLCYSCTKMLGGISLGTFSFVSDYSAMREEDIMHEVDGHTMQSRILGPLYLFVIGIPSIFAAAFIESNVDYYKFYTEAWANKCAGLTVDERGNLIRVKENNGIDGVRV